MADLEIAEIPYENGAIQCRYSRYLSEDGKHWVRHGFFVAYSEEGVVLSEGYYEHGLEQGEGPDFVAHVVRAPTEAPARSDLIAELELDLSDAYVDLIGGGVDLALRIAADVGPGLIAERLAPNRRLLCAAPAYLERHGTPAEVADLNDHHLLAAEGQLPWKLARPGRAWNVEGRSRVRTNSSEIVRELALAGAGIALRSLWDVGAELADGRLVRVLPEVEGSAVTGILLVRPKAARVPAAVDAFANHLRALFQPTPPWERT